MTQNTAICAYENSIEGNWTAIKKELEGTFGLNALVDLSNRKNLAISPSDWQSYFDSLKLSKSSLRFVKPDNDNSIVEMAEHEIDYVVGGVAAVPVLGAAVVVAAAVALGVYVFVAANTFVSVNSFASVYVYVSS